jgi:hypothetical protein
MSREHHRPWEHKTKSFDPIVVDCGIKNIEGFIVEMVVEHSHEEKLWKHWIAGEIKWDCSDLYFQGQRMHPRFAEKRNRAIERLNEIMQYYGWSCRYERCKLRSNSKVVGRFILRDSDGNDYIWMMADEDKAVCTSEKR